MGTELVHQPGRKPLSQIPTKEEWESYEKLAQVLIDNKMVPGHLDTPAKVLGCFITGRELGIGPVASTRMIYPTGAGKIGLMATLMRALCYHNIKGFQLQIEQSTDQLCKGRAKRGDGEWTSFTFTMEDARRAGLKMHVKQYAQKTCCSLCSIFQ